MMALYVVTVLGIWLGLCDVVRPLNRIDPKGTDDGLHPRRPSPR